MDWKPYLWVIVLIVGVIGFQSYIGGDESKTLQIPIQENTFFDPVCVGNQTSKIDYSATCGQSDIGAIFLGSSTNLDYGTAASYLDNHAKVLFIKIPLSQNLTSNIFNKITLNDAKLTLMTQYAAVNYSSPEDKFFVINGMCSNADWSEKTSMKDLPCIDSNKFPHGVLETFSEPFKPHLITKVDIDLKPHIETAREDGLSSFTEMIEFDPVSFATGSYFSNQEIDCLLKAPSDSVADACVAENRIVAYSANYNMTGVRPQLIVEYDKRPTDQSQAISIAMIAFIPTLTSLIHFRQRKNDNNLAHTDDNVVSNDSDKLAKKLAFLGILYSATISIGASFLAVGASLNFSILPTLRDYILKGGTNSDFTFIGAMANLAAYFIYAGLIIIGISVLSAYSQLFRKGRKKEKKNNQTFH